MARAVLYTVHVGKNAASLQPYSNIKVPRLTIKVEEGSRIEAVTELDGFELPFVIIFVGALLSLLGYLLFTWNKLPDWGQWTLGSLAWLLSLLTILYGLGRITKQTGLRIRSGSTELWRRFFWMTKSKILQDPKQVICTATRSPEDTTCFTFDLCLTFPKPEGMISILARNGYTQIADNQGARRKPYETVMQEMHEKAAEIADQLEIDLRPTFKGGPIPDGLIKLFKKRGLDLEQDEEEEEINYDVD